MKRREFITLAAAAGATMAVAARAQQPGKTRRIIIATPPGATVEEMRTNPYNRVFLDRLASLGFVEGQNLIVDRYSAEGHRGAYRELAQAMVNSQPDAILTAAPPMTLALQAETRTIPVVTIIGDPVALGLVSSLARPGGNFTGVTVDAGVEIHGKRLSLLLETKPGASSLAYLSSSSAWNQPQAAMVRSVAQQLKLSMIHVDLGSNLDQAAYSAASDLVGKASPDVMLVSDEPEYLSNANAVVEIADHARIPAMYPFRDLAAAGGLMAYYRDLAGALRHAADQTGAILKGESPAEIPFYQPTSFLLSINAKAAQKIGLELPATLLASADDVIE
jgi:putative ABC transport system substrate-binding protein